MKKILCYIDSMQMGGANRVMANLVDCFCENQIQVVLVNDIKPLQDVPEYNLPSKIERVYLGFESENAVLKNFYRISKLRKIIKAQAPDTVLSFMGPPNIRMLLATRLLKCRKIVSVRNDPKKEYGIGIKKLIANIAFCLADGVVFQTKEASEYFCKFTAKKSKIILNPVNLKFFNCRWKCGGTEITVVGRLEKQKNPMNVIRAYEKLLEQINEYKLTFYGDGDLRPALEKYVSDKNLSDKIHFRGRTNEVENVLENAALYVLCSDYEGMPNALMEAMTVGVPCISTDCPCGGPRELIEDETQGVLVPCNDSLALAEAMFAVLSDERRKKQMSENARKRALDFHANKILKEWDSFLNGKI